MTSAVKSVTGTLLIALVLAGCTSMGGKTAGRALDDTTITAAEKSKLAAERVATLTRIGVDTNQGTVYLTGTVDSPAMKDRSGELARQVKGGPRGCQRAEGPEQWHYPRRDASADAMRATRT